jgi:hypothetical protein
MHRRVVSVKYESTDRSALLQENAAELFRRIDLWIVFCILCTGAFLYVPNSFLLISNKFCGWGGGSAVRKLYHTVGWGGGTDFFGPQMTLA